MHFPVLALCLSTLLCTATSATIVHEEFNIEPQAPINEQTQAVSTTEAAVPTPEVVKVSEPETTQPAKPKPHTHKSHCKWKSRVVFDKVSTTQPTSTPTPTPNPGVAPAVSTKTPPLVRIAYSGETAAQTARGKEACGICHKCRAFYDCKFNDSECQRACDFSRNCIDCRLWTDTRMSDSVGFDIDVDFPEDWKIEMELGDSGVIELRKAHSEL